MLINYEDTNKIQIEFPQNGKFPRSGMHIPYQPKVVDSRYFSISLDAEVQSVSKWLPSEIAIAA